MAKYKPVCKFATGCPATSSSIAYVHVKCKCPDQTHKKGCLSSDHPDHWPLSRQRLPPALPLVPLGGGRPPSGSRKGGQAGCRGAGEGSRVRRCLGRRGEKIRPGRGLIVVVGNHTCEATPHPHPLLKQHKAVHTKAGDQAPSEWAKLEVSEE